MNKWKLRKGEKIVFLALDFVKGQIVVEAYYLEEYPDNSGRFYVTTDESLINTFNQQTYNNLPDQGILVGHDFKQIKKYSENLLSKYNKLIRFLITNKDIYNNATKYFDFRDDYTELFTNFNYNSKLFNNLIYHPTLYKIRFWFNVLWKYLLGTIKQIFYLLIFLKDLVVFLYQDYFNYRCAKNELKSYIRESEPFLLYSLTDKQRNQEKENREKVVGGAKETYSRSNISFFAFLISVITILVTTVFFTVNLNNKDGVISKLEHENKKLEYEILEIKSNDNIEYLNKFFERQNEINEKLLLNLNELTNIINEIKNHP
jgi:hypothetical protein